MWSSVVSQQEDIRVKRDDEVVTAELRLRRFRRRSQRWLLSLRHDLHVPGLFFAKGQVIAAQAEFDRIAQRRPADDFDLAPLQKPISSSRRRRSGSPPTATTLPRQPTPSLFKPQVSGVPQ